MGEWPSNWGVNVEKTVGEERSDTVPKVANHLNSVQHKIKISSQRYNSGTTCKHGLRKNVVSHWSDSQGDYTVRGQSYVWRLPQY
jgi:hypothetical protein